jgi:hypothetical protein
MPWPSGVIVLGVVFFPYVGHEDEKDGDADDEDEALDDGESQPFATIHFIPGNIWRESSGLAENLTSTLLHSFC